MSSPFLAPRRRSLILFSVVGLLFSVCLVSAQTTVYIPSGTGGISSSANGNVGVGTSSPQKTLSIAGGVLVGPLAAGASAIHLRGTGTGIAFNRDADTGSMFNSNAHGYQWQRTESTTAGNDNLSLQVYSPNGSNVTANALAITGAGNVGIGTASPGRAGSLLQAQTDQNATTRVLLANDSSGSSSATEFILNASGNSWALGMGSSANNSNGFYIGKDVSSGTPAVKYLSITTAGNVGIGTTSPQYALHIAGSSPRVLAEATNTGGTAGLFAKTTVGVGTLRMDSAGNWAFFNGASAAAESEKMRIDSGGNVGIGTTSPGYAGSLLQVQTDQNATTRVLVKNDNSGSSSATEFVMNAYGNSWALGMGSLANNSNGFYIGKDISSGTPAAKYLSITTSGNVGIGTTNIGSYKLAVEGAIRARSVVVDNTTWPDYVFADDYRLAPLSEVEAHIKNEKHLPGIPSAVEVAAGGVSLGDMQARLLAKVEELTLHVIRQEKEIQSLKGKLKSSQR